MDYKSQEHLPIGCFQGSGDEASSDGKLSPQTTCDTHFYAIIRHGERANAVPGLVYKNQFDPPLTQLGIQQAIATGKHLKEMFRLKGWTFSKVIIESSPFLRSMQTAAWVANELQRETEILIDYQISENITSTDPGQPVLDWHFKECPMNHLEYSKSGADFDKMKADDAEYCTSKYFPEIHTNETSSSSPLITFVEKCTKENQVEKELIHKAFPEKGSDVFERAFRIARSSLTNLRQYATDSKTSSNAVYSDNNSVCVLQFSHGQFVDSVAQLLKDSTEKPQTCQISELEKLNDRKQQQQVVNFLKDAKYGFPQMCSISGYSLQGVHQDQVEVELVNYSDHVKDLLRKK